MGCVSAKYSDPGTVEQGDEIWVWVCCSLCVMTSYPVSLPLFFCWGLHPKRLGTTPLKLPISNYTSLEAGSRKML